MLVSVIIPTFNRPATTRRAVETALRQTVSDLEIVIVDDASEPRLDPGLLPPDLRIRIVRHDINRGAAAARNTGMREAKGDWIAFLDSDDTWQPDKLELQLREADQATDQEMLAIATGWRYMNKDGLSAPVIPLPATRLDEFARGCWFCPGSTLLIRRQAALRIGKQDESLRRLEDYEWFLRFAALGGTLAVVQKPLAEIHHYSGYTAADVKNSAAYIAGKICKAGQDTRIPDAGVRRKIKAYLALTCAAASWHNGERVRGLAGLFYSMTLQPRLTVQNGKFWM